MTKKYFFEILFLFLVNHVFSQTGINTTNPESVLDVKSNGNGILFPRISETQKAALPLIDGTILFNKTLRCIQVLNNNNYTCSDGKMLTKQIQTENIQQTLFQQTNPNLASSSFSLLVDVLIDGDSQTFAFDNLSNSSLIADRNSSAANWYYQYGNPQNNTKISNMNSSPSDGGYFVFGTVDGEYNGGPPPLIPTYMGIPSGTDMLIYKLDSFGQQIWSKRIGSESYDFLTSGFVDNNEDILICGNTTGFGYLPFTNLSMSPEQKTNVILKLSNFGDILWTKYFDFEVKKITNSNDGQYIAVGSNGDMVISKLDLNGNILWTKTYGGSGIDDAFRIIALSDGYLVSGESDSNDGIFNSNYGKKDIILMKVDLNGNLVWKKNYGGNQNEFLGDIVMVENNNILITGTTLSYNSGIVTTQSGNEDIWVVKVNSSGDLIWQRAIGGIWSDWGLKTIYDGNNPMYYSVYANYGSEDINSVYISNAGINTRIPIDQNGNLVIID